MEFITGNKFKKICHYSYDENGFIKHSEQINGETLKIFVKIDYVHSFFELNLDKQYILFTHNGDLPVDDNYLRYMDNPNLLKWYGQNIMTYHPKVTSIPIGIANEIWPHGDEKVFNEVINQNLPKERLIYVNFDVNTNRRERNYCLSELNQRGFEMGEKLPLKQYLQEVAKSYFIVSPNGNGIDCHKTWEALYLGAIPIVTKSINIEHYINYPIIMIDSWSDFDQSSYTIELYKKLWSNFDQTKIYFNYFIN
jgi:hypothetical protein